MEESKTAELVSVPGDCVNGEAMNKSFSSPRLPPRQASSVSPLFLQHYAVLQTILDEIKKRHLFDHTEDGLRLFEEQAEMLTGRQSTQWHVSNSEECQGLKRECHIDCEEHGLLNISAVAHAPIDLRMTSIIARLVLHL